MNNCSKALGPTAALVAVIISFKLANVWCLPLDGLSTNQRRYSRQVSDDLLRKAYDFSTTCEGNIVLTLNGKQLNQGNLRLTASDAAVLAPALLDQPFEERIDVWCKVAKLTQELAESIGEQINIFDVNEMKLFQDDILLTKDSVDDIIENDPTGRVRRTLQPTASNPDQQHLRAQRTRFKRKVIASSSRKWPNGIIPWVFDDNGAFNATERQVIIDGMKSMETETCLRFPQLDGPRSGAHIRFIKNSGCYSVVGKSSQGQPVSIGDGCSLVGIVIHEIGHAIGFSHEQSRPDRNRYVRINTPNVPRRLLGNFQANTWARYRTTGIPYDYGSIMHYSAKAGAIDRSKFSVIPYDEEMRRALGQIERLSFWDAKLANKWYCSEKCPGSTTLEWDRCQHNGYRNPNKCTECLCPSGLAPPFCEEVVTNPKCGDNEYIATRTVQVFQSPGFKGSGHPLRTFCPYRFTAPVGMTVKFRFKSFSMASFESTCDAYVEVRYKRASIAGPKFCGDQIPTQEFVSHGESAMVTFHTGSKQMKGFELEYSAEPCGGCSSSPSSEEPACLKTEFKDCSIERYKNTCYDLTDDSKRYCCQGYRLSGQRCISSSPTETTTQSTTSTSTTPVPTPQPIPWGPWSAWSKCSRRCGQCGRQYRTRRCHSHSLCRDEPSFEIRSCNTRPCPAGTPTGFCDLPRIVPV